MIADTLFYLCARYNYAARGDVKESLSLYTLGHIFSSPSRNWNTVKES